MYIFSEICNRQITLFATCLSGAVPVVSASPRAHAVTCGSTALINLMKLVAVSRTIFLTFIYLFIIVLLANCVIIVSLACENVPVLLFS